MEKKVLIIVPAAFGHVSASLIIADLLKKHQYKIIYFISNNFKDFVTTQGYDVFLTDSLPIGLSLDLDMTIFQNNKSYLDKLKDNINEVNYEKRKNHLLKAYDLIKPDMVIVDSAFTSADFIILYNSLKENRNKFFFLQTQLSSKNSEGIPYIDSIYTTNQIFKILIEKYTTSVKKIFKRIKQKIYYLGYDEISMIYSHFKTEKISTKYWFDKDNYNYWSFKNIPEFITSPIELEFNGYQKKENQHYLGLFEPTNQPINLEILEDIIGNTKKEIVYISFGTQYSNEMGSVISFLKKIDEILEGKNNLIGILSLGNTNINLGVQFKNIKICGFVPQVQLLKYCKLFINHGGLNSVKEAINNCVPMLLYPVKGDMVGTSRKVAEKGLGIYGDLNIDSLLKIKQNFNYILENEVIIKTKLTDFKNNVNQKYNMEKILMDIINDDNYIIE
jgi:zeaxanthin glucosyltransferase